MVYYNTASAPMETRKGSSRHIKSLIRALQHQPCYMGAPVKDREKWRKAVHKDIKTFDANKTTAAEQCKLAWKTHTRQTVCWLVA